MLQTEELLVSESFDRQLKNVAELLKNNHNNEQVLKENIINLALLLEKSNEGEKNQIYSMITGALRTLCSNLDPRYINRKVYSALEKHPEYFIYSEQKQTEESDENVTYNDIISEYTHKLSRINISKLTKEQAENFIKKLEKISRAKINEAKHEYDINTKDIEQIHSPLDEIETRKVTMERETQTVQPDEITWKLEELQKLIFRLIQYSCHYHAPTQYIKEKMLNSLDRTIERLEYIIDRKDKATFEDWSNISLYSEEYKPNAGRKIKFPTSLCKYCKEIDYEYDAEGKKGIYQHMSMRKEYVERYDPNKPYDTQPIYVWRCPKCGGTESLEIALTPERIKSNYRRIIEVNTMNINVAGFDNFAEIFGKSCVQVFKMNQSKDISNKLLSKK